MSPSRGRTLAACCLGVLAIAALAACGGAAPAPPAARPARDWNLVLISIDTLRADRLPPYGYDNVSTPAISQLAAEGTTFRWAFSPAPLTLPAHASIFTGLQPFRHGVRDNGGFTLDAKHRTLAASLKTRGYATAAFVSAFVLDSQWGLDSGFDHYYDDFNVSANDLSAMARVQRPGGETWAQARQWLDRNGDTRFFVWLHLFDPHTPYAPPDPYKAQYAGREYDGEIAYSDAIVAEAVDWLRRRSLLDRTIVVVLSDHGEGLGDHGEDEHGLFAYDSTLRVPWIMRVPGLQRRGVIVDREVGLVDVTPTLLGLLGIAPPAPLDGVDVSPLIAENGTVSAEPLYAETYYPRLRFNWSELVSLRDGRYKFIRAPRPELYDYRSDPQESRNLIAERADVAARFTRILDGMERQAAAPTAKPIGAEAARRLASLGYISAGATGAASSQALPDPKDRAETYRQLARARELLQQGPAREGVALLEAIVRAEPELDAARRLLREYWLQRNETRRGLDWFTAAQRQRPDFAPLLVDVGSLQRAAGDLDGSTQTFDRALTLAPDSVDALSGAAETHRAAGRLDRALELFKRAAAQTADPTPTMRIAETMMRMGRIGEAEQIVRGVLAANPDLGGAHYLLALAAEQRRDLAAAEREYRTEMSLTPWDHRAPFNLAVLLGERRDFQGQVQLLESVARTAPDFAEVDFFLAKALLDLGDRRRFPEAAAAARRGLQRAPGSAQAPLAHYVLADLYTLEGRSAEAARELRRGQELERRLSAPPGSVR